jgi:hypothetical protein
MNSKRPTTTTTAGNDNGDGGGGGDDALLQLTQPSPVFEEALAAPPHGPSPGTATDVPTRGSRSRRVIKFSKLKWRDTAR